ncbi:MAG: hypothetical protein PHW95_02585 [Patescibacteria group bacterium]|nr:hypothetical protein [Patescibacteria group bacterium]
MNKSIGIILILLAGLILLGLASGWSFFTWRFMDYIIIAANVVIGVMLINVNDFNDLNIKSIFKSRKFKFIVVALIFIAIIFFVTILSIVKINEENLKCKFNISDVVENRFQEDKDAYSEKCVGYQPLFATIVCKDGFKNYPAKHLTYWEINGLLKNNSKYSQYLKSIVLKIYTNDERKILLAENFLDINESLTSDQSYPFQVRAQINRDSQIGKYFNKDDKVKVDIYPYFASCTY